jgi:hypothetical protein
MSDAYVGGTMRGSLSLVVSAEFDAFVDPAAASSEAAQREGSNSASATSVPNALKRFREAGSFLSRRGRDIRGFAVFSCCFFRFWPVG